jgi:hypothetical protein
VGGGRGVRGRDLGTGHDILFWPFRLGFKSAAGFRSSERALLLFHMMAALALECGLVVRAMLDRYTPPPINPEAHMHCGFPPIDRIPCRSRRSRRCSRTRPSTAW